MNVRHRVLAVGTALSFTAAMATMAACGTPHHTVAAVAPAPAPVAVSYAPAAYGVPVGGAFDCYYVDDVDEVASLVAAGLCPPGSIATAMPLLWHERYALYYGSSAYFGTYIPYSRRDTYTSITVVNFNKTYSSQITAASKTATYKDSTGKTVTGDKLPAGGKVTFGSGVAPKANLGSGTTGGTTGGKTTTGGTSTTGGSTGGTSTTGGSTGGKSTTGGTTGGGKLGGGTTGGTAGGSKSTTGGSTGGSHH